MTFQIDAIGTVVNSRAEAEDDFWGGATASIVLNESFAPDALQGLDAFSHAEVIFVFDRVDASKIITGARHPRNNPEWPLTGIFAQRAKNRPNRIGSTICRIVRVEGRTVFVGELDAIDGTPVVDIKPVMQEFLPREAVRQPDWSRELMAKYWSNAKS